MLNFIEFSLIFVLFIQCPEAIMLKKECPPDETHKSCSFYEEYTCWENKSRAKRVMKLPQRLTHCRAGCFCKKGTVRAYPQGVCLMAAYCRDQRIETVLRKLPPQKIYYNF